MKRIFAIILLSLAAFSCIQNSLIEPRTDEEEGYQTIDFGHRSFDEVKISTRATLPGIAECRVINLYVFVFDNSGRLVYKQYFDAEKRVDNIANISGAEHLWYISEGNPSAAAQASRYTWGRIRIKSPNVTDGRIYIIANIDEALFTTSRASLALVKSEADLNEMVSRYNEPTSFRMGNFIMTGRTSVTINGSSITLGVSEVLDYQNSQITGAAKRIMLKRLDAKITFKVAVVPGAVTERQEMLGGEMVTISQPIESFTPTSWQVLRLPNGSYLTEQNIDAAEELIGGYFDTPEYQFESKTLVNSAYGERVEHEFGFYMLENRKPAKQSVGGDYHLRDKRIKEDDGTYSAGDMWEYAPEQSTYVKIQGTVMMGYNEVGGTTRQTLYSIATYYIHLGDFIANGLDDYNVERNTSYTYTVNIYGVDKVQVEVERDKELGFQEGNEEQSGATGDVFISQEKLQLFDAHYDQRVFRFNVDGILKQNNGEVRHLTWYVSTPFGRKGVPIKVGTEWVDAPIGLDYKWIHFLVNSKEQSYVEPHGSTTGGPRTVTNPQYPNYCQYNRLWPEGGKENEELMDVIDLCKYLREQTAAYRDGLPNAFDSEGNLFVTAFVDEFYYDVDPISLDRRSSLWREFVNKPMRTLHILCDSNVSIDSESSIVKSAVSVRQLAIQTIYDLNGAEEGWGTESTDEMGASSWFFNRNETRSTYGSYQVATGVNAFSDDNGLYNSGHLWGVLTGGANTTAGTAKANFQTNKAWQEHLDYVHINDAQYVHMRDSDTDATLRYSCLMRNRDENGNGIIEKEEIKWYMASLGQLQELFIGELGLTQASRLYNNEDKGNGTSRIDGNDYYLWRNHIISSTLSSTRRPQFLWAEEGISIDNYGTEYSKYAPMTSRCVRNLDRDSREIKDITDPQDIPDRVAQMTSNADGTFSFDLSRLNEQSRRIKTQTELLPLDEKSTMARPYIQFQTGPIAQDGLGSADYITIQQELERGISRCPSGYRMPNIKEMAICYVYIPHTNSFWKNASGQNRYSLVCNYYSFGDTTTGGNGYDDNCYGWGVSYNNISVQPNLLTCMIRCVRDI